MTALMPDPDQVQRAVLVTTQVPNLRAVPLNQLADTAERIVRRIMPPTDAQKPPTAAFDASL